MKRCPYQGKVKYHDVGSATRAIRLGERMRPYVCPHCGFWHLTSKRKNEALTERTFAPSDPIRHNEHRRPETGFSNELEWPPVRLRAGPTRVFRLSKGTQA